MDWMGDMKRALSFIEDNLQSGVCAQDVSRGINVSYFYFQKAFCIITGYTVSEYIRNRRLYLAALDIISGNKKIIDIALENGYETPESFSKAFSRFHGVSPSALKAQPNKIKPFLPLCISLSIKGGSYMDFKIEKMDGFKVIGYERVFNMETAQAEIPGYWNEIFREKIAPLFSKPAPEGEEEETICNCKIGEFGVCIDDLGVSDKFRYLIAGAYTDGEIPKGMTVYEFPPMQWAKFKCVGPTPGVLQSLNNKIFSEWLPGNPDYDMSYCANIEWYSPKGNPTDSDYESAIWIPVSEK